MTVERYGRTFYRARPASARLRKSMHGRTLQDRVRSGAARNPLVTVERCEGTFSRSGAARPDMLRQGDVGRAMVWQGAIIFKTWQDGVWQALAGSGDAC